ncbi:GNAT family N-acetyltransferase [Amaricoccus tamworthensis]|uniref:GNAT family N-acetyltransferase n=1 Tax=Amaricoccus tamworthensis TaxID=57002 RepID=UPI003C7C5ECD
MLRRPARAFMATPATSARDMRDVLALRHARFNDRAEPEDSGFECILVRDTTTGEPVCTFRLMRFASGAELARSYSARYYDLGALAEYPEAILEIGRFCVAENARDPSILRTAWAHVATEVRAGNIGLLIGCSSFSGTSADPYEDAFALLAQQHLAPKRWLPRVKAPAVLRFARRFRLRKPDLKKAARTMPPLLKSYLAMGGWVSDHAVLDRDLNTLHVFTGVEVGRIPPNRARLLFGPAG